MSDDFRDYFNSRLNQEIEKEAQQGISHKYDEVQNAASLKIQQLEALKQRSIKVRQLQEGSLVSQIGLNPGGLVGTAVNTGVATVADIGDALAAGIATPLEVAGQQGAADSVRGFLNNDGAVAPRGDTWEEQSGLLRKAADLGIAGAKSVVSLGDAVIGVGDIATLGLAGKGWDALGRDSKATQKALDDLYSPEQKLANQNVEEAKGFLGTLEAMLDNPSTITTGIMESLAPMLAGGKIGQEVLAAFPKVAALVGSSASLSAGVAGAIGEGALMAGGQAEGIRQETADKTLSFKQALLAAGTGVMGAGVARLGNKAATKIGVGDIDEALVTGSLAKSPRGYLTSTVLGGAVESAEEGLQSAGETILKNVALDKQWDDGVGEAAAKGILTAAPLGAIGGMGARIKTAQSERAASQTRNEAQEAAIVSGDVTALADPKSATYDPARAIAALKGNSELPTATSETKQANLEKANAIVAGLESERATAQEAYDTVSPEAIKGYREQLAVAKAANQSDRVTLLEEQLADVTGDPKAEPRLKLKISKLDRRLEQAREVMTVFTQDSQSSELDVASEAEAINTKVDVATAAARADSIINLSMAIPERLDVATAEALADNVDNGLTAAQRSYLRAFSAARVAENLLKNVKGVNQDIYTGGEGYVGLTQYRDRVAQALATGNKGQADKHITDLSKFAADHQAKAQVVEQAWEEGKGSQVVKTKDGQWVISPTRRPYAEVRRNGGLTLNTGDLVTSIQTESDAINKALSELNAAYAVKFSKGVSNVQNVPKAPAVSQTAVAEQQATQGAGSDRSSASDAGVPAAGARSTEVVAPGVSRADSQSTEQTAVTAVDSQAAPLADATVERAEGQLQSTNSNTETAVITAPNESAEQTSGEAENNVAELTQDVTVVSGSLTVMGVKSAEGTAYNLRNLIADYFTQSAGKETDSTQRPLVAVQDFLSKAWDKTSEFAEFDAESDSQVEVLRVFKEKALAWGETIQKNLDRRGEKFFHTDLMQFFIVEGADGRLDLEENLKTAMSYAAFSWIAENATRDAGNTDEEINLILGRDEDHPVERHERDTLRWVGTRQNVVSNALGQRAVQALGLKATKDAPMDLMPKLESALGAHIFKMLMDQGILVRSEVSPEVMASLTGKENKGALHQFLALARDENKLAGQADQVFKATMGTQGLLDKLFGVEAGLKDPSFKPVPFTQKTTRNTDQGVPTKLAEIIEKENAGASFLRQDMYDLMQHIGNNIALQIAGSKKVDPTETHAVNRSSNEAKNAGLQRELDRALGFFDQMGDKEAPLYFDHSVWKQQRVGIATNVVNPQTSKIHRHMLFRKTWETKVARNDAAQMENFHLRIAEGLGIKTDKQSNESSLVQYEAKVAHPEIQAAVAVLQKRLAGGDLSQIDQETLLAGVQRGGENMHSLDVLMALAHEAKADASGADTFTVQMMGEVDGVTNGPMLSHLLMGAANSVEDLFGLLNRGGFFQQGNEHNQYNLWREAAGHFDLYETTAGHMVTAVQGLMVQGVPKTKFDPAISPVQVKTITSAIYAFTGELVKDDKVAKAGRDIIKTPLTAMVFGSSVMSAVESMANKFVESVYAGIEDAAKAEDPTKTLAVIKNINVLMRAGGGPLLSESATIVKLMEHEFKEKQFEALKKAFTRTVGTAVSSTMEADFAPYIAQRQTVNLAAQTTFALYNAVHTGLRDELIAELVESGDIAVNAKTKEPLHDLTEAQENVLRKRLAKLAPVAHTLMSKDSGSLRAGLHISKSRRKLTESKEVVNDAGKTVTRRTPYEGDAKFATPFKDNGAKTTKTRAYEIAEAGPGVAMVPMLTHSLDSTISHYAADKGEVLNVHDAHGAGLATFEQTARNLNQATWDATLRYSPASEVFDALARTVEGLGVLIEEGNLPPAVMKNLADAVAKLASKQDADPATFIADVVVSTKEASFKADDMKLQALGMMQSIDQYALQGGNYEVTDKDREEAAALRADLSNVLSPRLTSAIATIEAAMTEKSDATEARPLEEDPPKAKAGQQLSPLQQFLSENPGTTAGELMKQLRREIQGTDRMSQFRLQLLRMLSKTVRHDLPVELGLLSGRYGAYTFDTKTGAEKIELSGLKMLEASLHELTHAALARLVASQPKNPLVVELDQLREKAAVYAKQQDIAGFEAALADVQEFITWGMTNEEFQRTVLSKISMESKTKGNALVNGMKTFIDKVVALLFAGSSKTEIEQASNGMTVLISNVSGLFNQVGTNGQPGAATINLSMAASPMGAVQYYSTLDIHNALNAGDVTSEFEEKLRNLLTGIVEKLHGPFSALKAIGQADRALTPFDVWQKALATGVAPFASSVQVSPLKVSEQEAFSMELVEATMRDVLSRNENTSKSAYKELAKLYTEMRDTIKASDFADPDAYDFIFGVKLDSNNRSEHLARFAAFGLAHQEFNKLMQVGTKVATKSPLAGKPFSERLQIIWEDVLEWFVGQVTKTFLGQNADSKLTSLVGQLVDIEAKKQLTLARRASGMNPMASIEGGLKAFGEGARDKLADAAGSNFVRNNRFTAVQAVGSLVRVYANDQVEGLMNTLQDFHDRNVKGKHGIVMGLMTDARGPGKVWNALALASTNSQRHRKNAITQTASVAMKSFANGGKDLKKVGKDAITQVFLRTGMHNLLGTFNMTEIENLLGNKPALDTAIGTLESQLAGFGKFKDHFIHQANALGYFKVTGRVKNETMMMNAHNIARLYGTVHVGQVSESQAKQAQPVIEKLIALYAMGYADATSVSAAKDTLRTENARTDGKGNGVEFVLALHKKLEQESLARLFREQEALAMHGYTPEIMNPHTEIKTANDLEGKKLLLQGYSKGAAVERDPADPDTDLKHIYVLKDGGLMPQLTGVISYTGKNAKGTKQHSGYMNVNTADGLANASLQADIMNAKPTTLASGARPDLTKAKHTFMAPVVNPSGAIVNWRYVMQDSTKNTLLDRNNSFEKILGMHAGSIYDKESTTALNTKAITAAREIYEAEYAKNPAAFMLVGPKSPDAEMRTIWSMLPDDTKTVARDVWGKDGMYVRRDQLTVMFGYRKYSLSEAFNKDPKSLDHLEKLFVMVMEGALVQYKKFKEPGISHQDAEDFAKRAAVIVRKGERAWQELVYETKDILVVKTGVVMMGNIWSNMSLLMISGVSLVDIVKHHLTAYRGYRAYHSDSEKIAELQVQLDTGLTQGQDARIRRDIALAKDSLSRNPVAELIDAGLMPTIVEDIGTDDDIYSYKSALVRKTERYTSKLNPTVLEAGRQIYMSHDTKLYQGLSRITQLSDFVARYTLFQHVTTRKDNPLSKADAIHEASETFINYDTPMHKSMQYLDDMGITMFTKYFIRIQRVLLKLSKENPARVMMGLGLDSFLGLGPIVLEGSVLGKIGNNPFGPGALNLPGTLDELLTVSSAMALVK